ncbi:MAG: hypothetical protein IKW96_13620 [Ruminococcus sp.]|uniref:dockerin type I domain-containing protein n=1 Tax=Ruminococcus sp. TaxID=41978 RepID=UPI0025FDDB29|nr:dockerin type I domain-containing protein [Ruminococcus sp.]MBR5684287.1 hypothetical protein [Ruminococcus sp.]
MDFILPKNAKVGDIYPIGIEYYYDGAFSDIFYNYHQDDEGKLQMAHVFTKGIQNGYIKIVKGGALGDPNGDGDINAVDASNILSVYSRISTKKAALTDTERAYCDVNKDGFVDAVDASRVLSYYAYISTNKGKNKLDFVTYVMNS